MKNFKVGYRVEVKCGANSGFVGSVCRTDSGVIGVEFLNWKGGHNCGGASKAMTGWNYLEDMIEPTNKPITDFSKI